MIRPLFMPLVIFLFLFTGCAPTAYRTGNITIGKFTVADSEEFRALEIRPEDTERARVGFQKFLAEEILKETRMTPSDQCSDYQVEGQITKIDPKIDSHFRMFAVTVSKEYEFEVEGVLRDCNTGAIFQEFDFGKTDSNFGDAMESVAAKVAKKIAKRPLAGR